MEGTSLAPATARDSAPRARQYNRRQNSYAELLFFAFTGRDPSVRLERDVRRVQLGTQIVLYVGSLVLREMARNLLRRPA